MIFDFDHFLYVRDQHFFIVKQKLRKLWIILESVNVLSQVNRNYFRSEM